MIFVQELLDETWELWVVSESQLLSKELLMMRELATVVVVSRNGVEGNYSNFELVLTTPAAGEVREFPEMRSLNLDFLLILSNIFCCLNCFDVSSDKRKQSCFWIWGSCQHLLR